MTSNLSQNIGSPKVLLILTIIGIIAIAATVYFEYQARQDDYMQLLERQASLFINTVRYASENALATPDSTTNDSNSSFVWIGQFLRRFQADENIEYVVIQFFNTIVAGSFKDYDETSLLNDQVVQGVLFSRQTRQRILQFEDRLVHETLTPFYVDGEPLGVLRLGLSMEEYQALQKDIGERLFILGLVLIVFGLIFINLLISYRHRRLLHRDLEQLQDYTTAVFNNLSNGVISVDDKRIVRSINKQALLFIGEKYHSVMEKPVDVLPANYVEAIESHLMSTIKESRVTTIWQKKSGERRLFSLQTSLVQNDDGSQNCLLIINDITHHSHLEEQRRRNQRLDAMRNLAFSVAHEIKNPLNAVNLLIDLIRKKFKPVADEDKLHKHLNTVSSEIHRISDIVEQYLRFSRPATLNLSDVHLPELLNEIADLHVPELADQNIQLHIDMVDHEPLQADRDQLKQMFINLIVNAKEAIRDGGRIAVSGRMVDIYYEVRLQDDGIGIPEKNLDAVFDLYFTGKAKGNGVGLSVAQQIVEAHSGTIDVESEEGEGATFIVRLPTRLDETQSR